MRVLLVSVDLEFSLAYATLSATALARPELAGRIELHELALDPVWLGALVEYGVALSRRTEEICRLLGAIEALQPEVLCFSCYLWNHTLIAHLVRLLARLYPQLLVVVGGAEVLTTASAAAFLAEAPTALVARGEGEVTFTEILIARLEGRSPVQIAGTSAKVDGVLVHNPDRGRVAHLDEIPSPFLSGLVDLAQFDHFGADGQPVRGRYERLLLETYRGCYMHCSYCQWGDEEWRRRAYSTERVLAEIDLIVSRGLRVVFVIDAMFGHTRRAAEELLVGMAESRRRHGHPTLFGGYHNQDFTSPALLDLYRQAGFLPEIDLQSANPTVLRNIGRSRWPVASYERSLSAFHGAGVEARNSCDLIVGLPGDSYSSFKESIDYCVGQGLNVLLFHTAILPGTPLEGQVEALGMVNDPDPQRLVLRSNTFPTADLLKARRLGYGLELTRRYPLSTGLLLDGGFARPTDLIEAFIDHVWRDDRALEHTRRTSLTEGLDRESAWDRAVYEDGARAFFAAATAGWSQDRRAFHAEIARYEAHRARQLRGPRTEAPEFLLLPDDLWSAAFEPMPELQVHDFSWPVHRVEGHRYGVERRALGPTSRPQIADLGPEAVSLAMFPWAPFEVAMPPSAGAVLRRLSPHFTLEECVRSAERARRASFTVQERAGLEEAVRALYEHWALRPAAE